MSRPKAPAFLLVAADAALRAEWKQTLSRHGRVRAFTSAESAERELASDRPWLAFVIAAAADGRSLHRFLARLRRSSTRTPGLFITAEAPRSLEALSDLGFRWLPEDAPAAEVRYFLGHLLALEVTGNRHVASAVEALGRERSLTAKQMELAALSTTELDRDALASGLGVSANTLKTRVRQLLSAFDEESMDTLGKTVLRVALSNASRPAFGHAPSTRDGELRVGALPAERGAEIRPAPKPARKRRPRKR